MFILLDLCRYNIGGVLISWHSPAWFINTAQAVKRYTSNRENLALKYTFSSNNLISCLQNKWVSQAWPNQPNKPNKWTCLPPWSDCLRGGHLIMKVKEIQVSILLSTEQKTWKNNSLSDSHCWPHAFLVFFFYRLWYNAHLSHTVEYIMDPQGLNYFISESEPFSLYWQVWRPGALIICLITLSTTLPVSAM